jgi:hypothetical protein
MINISLLGVGVFMFGAQGIGVKPKEKISKISPHGPPTLQRK